MLEAVAVVDGVVDAVVDGVAPSASWPKALGLEGLALE